MFTFNPLVLDHLLLALAVSSVLILTVAWRRRRLDAPKNPPSTDGDPIPYATADQQRAAFTHLARLPQFLTLPSDKLIDLNTGVSIRYCECDDYPSPHVLVCFSRNVEVALMTLRSLGRYLAWQDAIAGQFRPDITLNADANSSPIPEAS